MIDQNLFFNLLVSLGCFFFSWIMLYITRDFLKLKILDKPNRRSSHSIPTPSGGGISFVVFGSLGNLLLGNLIPLFCLPLAFVGFLDDIKGIPALLRYLVQILTVFSLILVSPFKVSTSIYFHGLAYSIFFIIVIILATGIINFCNFIDGLDGLLISCMIFVFITFLIMGDFSLLPIIGACIGFLLWNWYPAKVFMGDVGSTFLGAVYIGYVFESNDLATAFAKLLLLTPILSDCISCIIKRLMLGQNIFEAHKLHLYQRLNQAGWNHSKVTIIYSSSFLVLSLSYISLGLPALILFSLFILIIGYYLDKNYAVGIN